MSTISCVWLRANNSSVCADESIGDVPKKKKNQLAFIQRSCQRRHRSFHRLTLCTGHLSCKIDTGFAPSALTRIGYDACVEEESIGLLPKI